MLHLLGKSSGLDSWYFSQLTSRQYFVKKIESSTQQTREASALTCSMGCRFGKTSALQAELAHRGIKYQVMQEKAFFELETVKDAMAHLQLVLNLHDDLAFQRLLERPPKYLGEPTWPLQHALLCHLCFTTGQGQCSKMHTINGSEVASPANPLERHGIAGPAVQDMLGTEQKVLALRQGKAYVSLYDAAVSLVGGTSLPAAKKRTLRSASSLTGTVNIASASIACMCYGLMLTASLPPETMCWSPLPAANLRCSEQDQH